MKDVIEYCRGTMHPDAFQGLVEFLDGHSSVATIERVRKTCKEVLETWCGDGIFRSYEKGHDHGQRELAVKILEIINTDRGTP